MTLREIICLLRKNFRGEPYVKVIDWGLGDLKSDKNVPEAVKNRPIQFNAPLE